MLNRRKLVRGRMQGGRLIISMLLLISSYAYGQLGPQDVVILVNQNSPTSRYIAKLYRQYHPQITDSQVLYLSGLPDASGPVATPADEILTRQQYNDLIAGPVRSYLADPDHPERITTIKVIITTAGMPYRIKDTVFTDAVYAAGSNYNTIINQEASIDAASVESELTCLWYCDYNVYDVNFGRTNRMVNPYQGYHSSMSLFPRVTPGTKQFRFGTALSAVSTVENPRMEGVLLPPKPGKPPDFIPTYYYGTVNRRFHVGDMYLTARLDGPKATGQSAVFAVRAMLERAKRASSSQFGVNPAQAVAVFDDAPGRSENFDNNRTFNLNYGVEYLEYSDEANLPPDADQCRVREDYINGYIMLADSDPHEGILNIGAFPVPTGAVGVMLDRRNAVRTSQADLNDYAFANPGRVNPQGVILLATFGKNGDEGNPPNYLLVGGPGGGPLFNVVNGAVFTSIESFNAVTMFSDVNTLPLAQGKLVNFISIGGTAAVGHSFEPQPDAAIDNEFLFYNLLADDNNDGRADLTLVEAAFTAIPYLSWSEVLIGDPLMQIAYGPGGKAWTPLYGDADNSGRVNFLDIAQIKLKMGGALTNTSQTAFDLYNDLCDIDKNGRINFFDVEFAKSNMGAAADW
ncbi:MAG: hypothetical protein ABSG99_04110 [Sedimentisphaerales bacterium]